MKRKGDIAMQLLKERILKDGVVKPGNILILGVNAPVIIGHGCSSPQAIRSMILSTEQVIKADLTAKLQRAFQN